MINAGRTAHVEAAKLPEPDFVPPQRTFIRTHPANMCSSGCAAPSPEGNAAKSHLV